MQPTPWIIKSWQGADDVLATISERKKAKQKDLDSRGIEPRTTPMLREYYTTKPQAQLIGG